jgi:general secretion pathway protein K
MWVLILFSVITGSFVGDAGTEAMSARNMVDAVRARTAAEAGLHRAVYELRNSDPELRWVGNGHRYEFDIEGVEVSVELWDESGKIDINAADISILADLFESLGKDQKTAQELAGAIVDWRDPDDLVSPNGAEKPQYKRAKLSYGPRNRPFETLGEVQQVLGMDYELFLELEPAITIYSGMTQPNIAMAPESVLRSRPGYDQALVERILAMRQMPGNQMQIFQGLVDPVTGSPLVPQGGGITYTIISRADLPGGATSSFEATVQMTPSPLGNRPFRVMRWRDSEH